MFWALSYCPRPRPRSFQIQSLEEKAIMSRTVRQEISTQTVIQTRLLRLLFKPFGGEPMREGYPSFTVERMVFPSVPDKL